MKPLVIYDTKYGNTEKIALAIGNAIKGQVLHVNKVNLDELNGFDLLIFGSPTHGGFPTEGIYNLIKAIPSFQGIKVAAFDTRTNSIWNKIIPFGYAAPTIARYLETKGGILVIPPEGFIVLRIKGPLKDGELDRSTAWLNVINNGEWHLKK